MRTQQLPPEMTPGTPEFMAQQARYRANVAYYKRRNRWMWIAIILIVFGLSCGVYGFLMFKAEIDQIHSPVCQAALSQRSLQFMQEDGRNWQPFLDVGQRPLFYNNVKNRLTWVGNDGKVKVSYASPRMDLDALRPQFEELGPDVMSACYPSSDSTQKMEGTKS